MSARVLVVDDESALLPLLARYLRILGLQPECVGSAEEARRIFRDAGMAFNFVVVDLTLPDAKGEELAEEFLTADSALKALLMSGYPYSADQFPENGRERVAFIQKPFLPSMLKEVFEKWQDPEPPSTSPDGLGGVEQRLEPLGEVAS